MKDPGNYFIEWKTDAWVREIEDLGNGFFYIDYTNNRTGKSNVYRQAVVELDTGERPSWMRQDLPRYLIRVGAKNTASDVESTKISAYAWEPRRRAEILLPKTEVEKIKATILYIFRLFYT